MNNVRALGHFKAFAIVTSALILLAALGSALFWARSTSEPEHPVAPRSGPPAAGNSIEALAGEVDLENRFRYAVTVTPFPSVTGGISKQCSGVVVSPRLVLSAGHCFCAKRKANHEGAEDAFIIDSSACSTRAVVTALVYERTGRGSGPSFQAQEYQGTIRVHPGFKVILDKKGSIVSSTQDLAMLSLETPVDDGLAPVTLASTEVEVNEALIVVGHGYDETFGTLGGARRSLKTRVTALPSATGGRALLERRSEARYRGDSGGPCLRETAQGMELVGILNRSLGHEPSCTSTLFYGSWLKEELKGASATEQPSKQ